jgi:tetratricopeptide (TPR) repeat protein
VITEDPNFAPAYAALALMLTAAVTYGGPPHRMLYERIEKLAGKALELSDRLPEAHCALGWLRHWHADWPQAENSFLRALEINPNFSLGYTGYACLLSMLGRHEQAIALGKRARQLDPLSPIVHAMLGVDFYLAGQLSDAIECQQHAIEIDPGFCPAHAMLGFVYQEMGEVELAVRSLRAAVEYGPDSPLMRAFLARSLVAAGQIEEGTSILEDLLKLRKTNCIPATSIALIYAALKEREHAWSWLMTAMHELDPWRCYMAVDPRFRFFWNDRRFARLLHGMLLPSQRQHSRTHHCSAAHRR